MSLPREAAFRHRDIHVRPFSLEVAQRANLTSESFFGWKVPRSHLHPEICVMDDGKFYTKGSYVHEILHGRSSCSHSNPFHY